MGSTELRIEKKGYWKLLFDANCPMCIKFAQIIEGYDPDASIEYISLQDFYEMDQTIPLDELLEEIHMVNSDSDILRGSEAVQKIIEIIPKAKPLRWMIETRWGKKGTDTLYRALKKFRRCDECGRR